MPSKSVADVLDDLQRNILLAKLFVEGMSFEQFSQDQKSVYAVIRALEIISEASRRLPEEVTKRHPSIPWRAIAGAGNVYRHDYQDLTHDMIWRTVTESLNALESVVAAEITALGQGNNGSGG
ncbi:MAG: DUF86 domain-containing protein [Hyphomicrobiaceae bacterium]